MFHFLVSHALRFSLITSEFVSTFPLYKILVCNSMLFCIESDRCLLGFIQCIILVLQHLCLLHLWSVWKAIGLQCSIHRIISKQSCWRPVEINCIRYWWNTAVSITTLWFWLNQCVKFIDIRKTERERKNCAESYWKMIVILVPLNNHWALMMNFSLICNTVRCSVFGCDDLNGTVLLLKSHYM